LALTPMLFYLEEREREDQAIRILPNATAVL